MVQVELAKIIIDERSKDQVIVLRERGGERQIPIVIGFMEASSIKMKISGVEVPRPMTHDLLMSVIDKMGGKLVRLIIDQLVSNTFHAKLEIEVAGAEKKLVDARPSDGIALAVRAKCPIFVEEEVLSKASILNQ